MLSYLELLEIEIHSFCNRKCEWCPNKEINRTYFKKMPEEVFLSFLYDLKENNFRGWIAFTGYSESLAYPELFKKRVNQIKEILPHCRIKANSNGDYVNKENLKGLNLDRLCVNDYDCLGFDKIKDKIESSGIMITSIDEEDNKINGTHPNINVVQYRINWPKFVHLIDRAGYFEQEKNILDMPWANNHGERMKVCTEPLYSLYIDHNGKVAPCSNIRADYEGHQQFILGDISENKLSEIIQTEKFKSFMNILITEDYPNYHKTCHYCNRPNHFMKQYNRDYKGR